MGLRDLYLPLRQVLATMPRLSSDFVLLMEPSECWNCRHIPPRPVVILKKEFCNTSSAPGWLWVCPAAVVSSLEDSRPLFFS